MQIEFAAAPTTAAVVRIVNQDMLPADLDPVVAEGARASRFTGKAGQIHEAFVTREGAVQRLVLAGAGEAGAKDRASALERAGAAIATRYNASGLAALSLDCGGGGVAAGGGAGAGGGAPGGMMPIAPACPMIRSPRWPRSKWSRHQPEPKPPGPAKLRWPKGWNSPANW